MIRSARVLPILAALLLSPAALPTVSYAVPVLTALGDLSSFEVIVKDTLAIVEKGDLAAAKKRITDFETAWDDAEPDMRPKDKELWGNIDDAADQAIGALRASSPDQNDAKQAVTGLITVLENPAGK